MGHEATDVEVQSEDFSEVAISGLDIALAGFQEGPQSP